MAYKRKGIFWFKWFIDATSDPAVDQLLSEMGPAAYGTMVQVFSELHNYGNLDAGHPSSDYVVRRVSRALYSAPDDVSRVLSRMAELGLVDQELWSDGIVANEHASSDIQEYRDSVESGRRGGLARKNRLAG